MRRTSKTPSLSSFSVLYGLKKSVNRALGARPKVRPPNDETERKTKAQDANPAPQNFSRKAPTQKPRPHTVILNETFEMPPLAEKTVSTDTVVAVYPEEARNSLAAM